MTNDMIPASMMQAGALSTKFAGAPSDNLGEGIRGGFGILGYRGKVWSTKYQGKEVALMRDDGDGPRNSIEVVIVRAAPNIAKIYYASGFVDGSTAPPDCWSTDGVKPDGGASKKQSTTCAGCPMNAWGSKVTEAGKQAKACADSKRLAIAPLADLANEAMGGPMLLRVPAATLKDLKTYGDQLQSYGFPYYGVATRIAFDANEAFPKFVLTAIRPLTDTEAEVVLALRDDARVNNILNTSVEIVHHEPEVAVPASPFEQKTTVTTGGPATQVPTAAAAVPIAPTATTTALSPAQVAAAGAPAKRPRRTKAEMEAAAAALKAQREGAPTPAAPAAQPAQTQPTVSAAPLQTAEALTEGGGAAGEDFDSQLDSLLIT